MHREECTERILRAILHDIANVATTIQALREISDMEAISVDVRQTITSVCDIFDRTCARQLALRGLFTNDVSQNTVPVPIDVVAQRVIDDLRAAAVERRVTIVSETLPGTLVNPSMFELVFGNLLDNAIKYSDHEKTDRHVLVSAEEAPDGAWIVVRDNGCGVGPRHQEAIFEWSYRARLDRDGQGVGLTIARLAAARIGRGLELDPRHLDGACFRFHVTVGLLETIPASPPSNA